MEIEEGIITGSIYLECEELVRRKVRQQLKGYDMTAINGKNLKMKYSNQNGDLEYKLFHVGASGKELQIAEASINVDIKIPTVVILNLEKHPSL